MGSSVVGKGPEQGLGALGIRGQNMKVAGAQTPFEQS